MNEYIRQSILFGREFAPPLPSPLITGEGGMQVADILAEIIAATGWGQTILAKRLKVTQGTISKWKNGQQAPVKTQWDRVIDLIAKTPKLAHLQHKLNLGGTVAIVGRVGFGGAIEPNFNPATATGLYEVSLPFPVPDGVIGLVIEGETMLPKYEPGDVIVMWREQRRETVDYLGQTAAIKTADGQFLKKLFGGKAPGLFRLDSFNAAPVPDVSISWVGEIHVIVPATQVFEIQPEKPKKRAAGARAIK